MKTRIFCLFLLLGSSAMTAHSETINRSPNVLGETMTLLESDDKQPLTMKIWIPETPEQKRLPLLVVLDGQRYFNYAISMHHLMQDYEWTPKFAILGVDTSQGRWPMLSGQREAILEKLERDIFPYIGANYPISDERILFGWEAAGGFTLKTMMDKPELFNGYIAASPSPLYGEYFPMLEQEFQNMITAMTTHGQDKQLFVTMGSYDYPQYLGINELELALNTITTKKPRYTFTTIEDASHASLGFETLMLGVRDYFYFFDKPQFSSFQAFIDAGSFQYLDAYFKQQQKDFGLEQQQIDKNRFEILRKLSFLPLMDKNLAVFKSFLEQLKSTDFLDRSHINHIYRYGLFMLQSNDFSGAKDLFEYCHKRAPDNALPINGLGLVAKAENNQQEAKALFQQALELGRNNNDYRLPEYQQNLDQMNH